MLLITCLSVQTNQQVNWTSDHSHTKLLQTQVTFYTNSTLNITQCATQGGIFPQKLVRIHQFSCIAFYYNTLATTSSLKHRLYSALVRTIIFCILTKKMNELVSHSVNRNEVERQSSQHLPPLPVVQ